MDTIILRTKLFIPPTRSNLVARPHLVSQLDQDLSRKLTLISAPAGFGKTTLICDWLQNHPTAWLSVDRDDNDPIRFFTYVAAALQRQEANLGAILLSMLHDQLQIDLSQVITAMINGLAARPDPLFLVLDDYHLIDNPAVHNQVAFLLDNLPPTLHLVITSRADMPFSIARWRVQGQVVELRAADLRFTPAETAVFLNDLMQLDLTTGDIAALEARTEGWIASLQLAALSLRQQSASKRARFIKHFASSNRYLMDYLVDEILQQQSTDRKRFLLRTAILNRLCAPLCDAVLAIGDLHTEPEQSPRSAHRSQTRLDEIESANLFLIPLNDDHTWFRYHHLFADFLQHRLRQSEPGILPQLHDRAARWFAEHGYLDEAIYHALQIPDYAQATNLLAEHIETMVVNGNISQALHRINQLPADLRNSEQRLCLYHAWALMFVGQLAESERTLARLPTLPNPLGWPVAAFETVLRGYLTNRYGRFSDSLGAGIVLTEQALDQLAQVSNPDRTTLIMQEAAAVELAFSYTFENELQKALGLAQEAMRLNRRVGNTLAGLGAISIVAQLTIAQGHWQWAEAILQQGLTQARTRAEAQPWSGTRLPAAATLILNLGQIHYQWDDLDKAAPLIEEAAELYALMGTVDQIEGLVTLMRLRWAQGDRAAAQEILQKSLQPLIEQVPYAYIRRRLAALVVEWQIRFVQTGVEQMVSQQMGIEQTGSKPTGGEEAYLRSEIQHWLQSCGLQGEDPLNYRTESEYVTLVRAWCLMDQAEAALLLIHRLQAFAMQTERFGDAWRYQVLEVLVRTLLGETIIARHILQETLADTEPEGIIRLYVDEGQPIATLLQQLPPTAYRDRLLAAFHLETPQTPAYDPQSQLVERLSDRELEVLNLLATGATNQQIADDLIVSHATAKKHVSNITGKLGVQNRTSAVVRARELGLIG